MARSVGLDRARVVEAAAELADELGLENLALAHVAERLQVRRRRRKKVPLADRQPLVVPQRANAVWSAERARSRHPPRR